MKLRPILYTAALGAVMLGSCTKLNENTYASLPPSSFYNNETEALSSVANLYSAMGNVANVSAPWTISEIGSDEFVVPGRASGGWYDQNNIDIMLHKPTTTNTQIANAWTNIFSAIGSANYILENLNNSAAAASLKPEIAEAKALRAYFYFYALDFWGNVPIVTTSRLDQGNLPTNAARADVFKFVESEMLAAADGLPSASTVTAAYYPRMTKEAAYMVLATMYLNAQVYTGTQRWSDASAMCDKIISSGAYALEANVVDNFKVANKGKTKETIFAVSMDPTKNAGGNPFIIYAQPFADQQKYNLPFAPANGFSTFQVALDRYENQDNRKKLLEYGPQFYKDGVTPLLDSKGQQLNLINIVSYTAAADNEAYRVLKYVPDGATFSGISANNDLVVTRYADVLLTKAEAQFRLGNVAAALTLVNQVRARSNASALAALTLQNIEDERGREFIWEGHRRRDQIRFGDYFTGTWTFKTSTNDPLTLGVYPIPAVEQATNPNLKQNPGY
ncbi:putative outer membrane starch-binding protein [Mucilaginibacter yixingensis]|uniref:Putative outer membrane starch-binding protein n=1 Tax=Mucilaginibacter yixingensis TaxID=1295612 RepID=A0A2T5J812_9SPHI|nr:RagB/SusD family nutrient uptake outer membrane protein [Mucilaginibacter yixingensis]PTQ95529.1 putative outer membrane starch-binding protein [Mucilaginibacter yixingensis]